MKTLRDHFVFVTLMSVTLVILAVVSVHAAPVNWTDATGFWDVAANWSSNPLLRVRATT